MNLNDINFSALVGMPSMRANRTSNSNLILSGLPLAVLLFVLGYFSLIAGLDKFAPLLLIPLFGTVLIGAQLVANFLNDNKSKKVQEALGNFANINSFEYTAQDKSVSEKGSLFDTGVNKHFNNILSGKLGEYNFRLGDYHYEEDLSQKNRRVFDVRVMRLELPRKLPHMVIDCLIEAGEPGSHGDSSNRLFSTLPISFDPSQKLELEGDFYKYFTLYAPDKYAVDMLSIIGPDTMEKLLQMKEYCDIEIVDKYIYFYWPDETTSKENFEAVFETTISIMNEIGKKLSTTAITAGVHKAINAASSKNPIMLKKGGSQLASWLIFIYLAMVLGYFTWLWITTGNPKSEVPPEQIPFVMSFLFLPAILTLPYVAYYNHKTSKLEEVARKRY